MKKLYVVLVVAITAAFLFGSMWSRWRCHW